MAKATEVQRDSGGLNVFARIGLFVRQMIDELRKVVTPTRTELLLWSVAVFIFVLLLMLFVSALDYGLGKLVLQVFG